MPLESRRNTLKSILAGSSAVFAGRLPESWTRPVIDTVFVPAHAQATCQVSDDTYTLCPNDPGTVVPAPGVLQNDTCGSVVSNSSATVLQNGPVFFVTVQPNGGFEYEVDIPETIFRFTYTTESGAVGTVTVYHDVCGAMEE